MAADLDILPVIRLHEFKCGGDGKYCRWVSRPGPLQEIDKGGLARLGEPGLVAPTDDQRLYQVLDLGVGIQKKPAPLGLSIHLWQLPV